MDSRATRVLAITGITLLSGALAYAYYFDYKRRNDAEFRKNLRKEKKRVSKAVAQSKESLQSAKVDGQPSTFEEALELVRKEEPPASPEEKESYFMSQVAMGEQLSAKGPSHYLAAATCFYRAMKVYPSPMELMVIYEQTLPQPIVTVVIQMMSADVSPRFPSSTSDQNVSDDEETSSTSGGPPSETSSQEWDKVTDPGAHATLIVIFTCFRANAACDLIYLLCFYEAFPPKSMKTRVEGRRGRKVLIVTEDVAAGEVIYKEQPVVTALDADLQESGKYCAHCLRSIQSGTSVELSKDANPINSTFCSKACLTANKTQSHNLLFTSESPLPPALGQPLSAEGRAARLKAQERYIALLKKEKRAAPVLLGRFIARQIAVETAKMSNLATPDSDFTNAEGYLLADHIERLRYIDLKPDAYATLLGKITYNAFGVCFGDGRDDKVTRPEDVEKTRTPLGTSRQIGTAFYTLSCYLAHSCDPNAHPSFSSGTAELSLVATRDLKKGDELTIAYVDVKKREGETTVECRRRRRIELVRGWRFACPCQRCVEEGKELSGEEKVIDATLEKDGSKVDAVVSRYDSEVENNNVE
ncbi:Mitochondrial import receptor subunit tom20 [Termitomyces sp. J132]|nr:Mitochondrial import receptor subunit tom20 [Termitomyces sp. J132]